MQNSGKLNTSLGIFAGVNECSLVQNSCLLRLILAIPWLKVVKNFGIAEMCVFLGRIFGISLASGSEETWCFQNSCLSGLDEFHSVGELSCWGCELEIELQIAYPSVTGKVRKLRQSELNLVNFLLILACVIHTVSESE